MELDQEKQNQEAAERCRALAQRIVRELAPRSVQVLEDSGLLEKAFCKMNTAVVQSAPELLVVTDPQWVSLPAIQAEKVLLVCAEYAGMADCAKQLAAQGFCRELAWKDRGKEQLTALFCRMAAPELPELEDGYEQQLDVLRERTLLAERTAAQQTAVGCIHDAVTVQLGNVSLHDFQLVFDLFGTHGISSTKRSCIKYTRKLVSCEYITSSSAQGQAEHFQRCINPLATRQNRLLQAFSHWQEPVYFLVFHHPQTMQVAVGVY